MILLVSVITSISKTRPELALFDTASCLITLKLVVVSPEKRKNFFRDIFNSSNVPLLRQRIAFQPTSLKPS